MSPPAEAPYPGSVPARFIVLAGLALASGCYLSHERGPAARPDAGADAEPGRDARTERDAGEPPAACVPGPPARVRPPAPPCDGPRPPGGTTRAELGPGFGPSLATDGCDVWAALGPDFRLLSLDLRGLVSEEAVSSLSGVNSALVVDGSGARWLFVESLEDLAFQRRDASGWSPPEVLADADRPRLLVPEPRPLRATVARPSGASVVWRTEDPFSVWLAEDPGGAAPRRLAGPRPEMMSMPRYCLAGTSRDVVVWMEAGRARAWVRGDGLNERTADLGPSGGAARSTIDVACAPDGRALAVWIGPDGEVRTSSLDPRGCWLAGPGLAPMGDAFYPHVWLVGDRALLTWSIAGGSSFVRAIVDPSGVTVRGPVASSDLDGDGEPDRFLHGCATPDGFAVLTQTHRVREPSDEASAWLTIFSATGEPRTGVSLGPFRSETIMVDVQCDRHGRVTALFRDDQMVLASWIDGI